MSSGWNKRSAEQNTTHMYEEKKTKTRDLIVEGEGEDMDETQKEENVNNNEKFIYKNELSGSE